VRAVEELEAAAIAPEDLARDGQTDPKSIITPRIPLAGLEEPLEDFFLQRERNAMTFIPYCDL
jgi:hypothetical protein